tara:strand:+ start:281 stop:559 length:279 start_codon:yes stop_codon:yes gene_type:complete
MPYIKPDDRLKYGHHLMSIKAGLSNHEEIPVGELNYIISTMIAELLENFGLNYSNGNKLIGVLECAKLELYRRMLTPYENQKIIDNGDVYYD